jgi:DNA phosphorothioation-associated putative methyltransferase
MWCIGEIQVPLISPQSVMDSTAVARHRTALKRVELSRPIRLGIQDSLINSQTTVLDYGCGLGDDVRHLRKQGVPSAGWDPFYSPLGERSSSDVVNLGYVVNVIEDPNERARTLQDAWSYAKQILIVSARLTLDVDHEGEPSYADGYVTRLGTFQKLFEQHELRQWIETTLGESGVAAAPGVFYVFRDQNSKYAYVSARLRRRAAIPRQTRSDEIFEAHKESFDALIEFFLSRGRLPVEQELPSIAALCEEVGSVRRAFAIVRRVTGAAQWEQVSTERAQDLLVYLALARFSRRPKYSALPLSLQLDLRAFFSSYKRARQLADTLLFSAGDHEMLEKACRSSLVGKLTPTALYVHQTALEAIDPILRVYEGCARTLIGAVEQANIIKLHFAEPVVSYLSYPNFETDPHPSLAASFLVHLQTFKMRFRQYTNSENPPILHRKELFVRSDDPLRGKYERLTQQEEAKGLYAFPSEIGTRTGWEKTLEARHLRLRGHRLVSCKIA